MTFLVLLSQAWTSVFPRDNILFLRNEDYQAAPREHLAAVLKFLGEIEILIFEMWVES